MLKVFIARYAANALVALEIFVAPMLISPNLYGELEYTRYLVSLVQIAFLGAYTGYIYYYYKYKNDYYSTLFFWGVIVALFASIFYSSFVFKDYVAAVGVFLFAMSVVFERRLQVLQCLVSASFFKAWCSLSLLVLLLTISLLNIELGVYSLFSFSIITGSVLWFLFSDKGGMRNSFVGIESAMVEANKGVLLKLIKNGFIINISSQILMLFYFYDRSIVKENYLLSLPSYSLAFNAAQIVFIAMNTLALFAQSEIGEKLENLNRRILIDQLWRGFKIYLILSIASAFFCYFYAKHMEGYNEFFVSFLVIVFVYGPYYLLGIISICFVYLKIAWKMFAVLSVALVLNMMISEIMINIEIHSYMLILFKSGLLLLISGFALTHLIFERIK